MADLPSGREEGAGDMERVERDARADEILACARAIKVSSPSPTRYEKETRKRDRPVRSVDRLKRP